MNITESVMIAESERSWFCFTERWRSSFKVDRHSSVSLNIMESISIA